MLHESIRGLISWCSFQEDVLGKPGGEWSDVAMRSELAHGQTPEVVGSSLWSLLLCTSGLRDVSGGGVERNFDVCRKWLISSGIVDSTSSTHPSLLTACKISSALSSLAIPLVMTTVGVLPFSGDDWAGGNTLKIVAFKLSL